jgi:NDP-sugar pyrophosphorylase family protein
VIRSSYHQALARGERMLGIVEDGRWEDLGTHAAYLRANVALASGAWAYDGVSRDERGIVHPSVGAEAKIVDSVVGEGVTAAPGVRIERCVVWAGTHVAHDVADAILTPRERIAP